MKVIFQDLKWFEKNSDLLENDDQYFIGGEPHELPISRFMINKVNISGFIEIKNSDYPYYSWCIKTILNKDKNPEYFI